MIMALLLDLANIVGGFLLAVAVLRLLPRVGDDVGRLAGRVAPIAWVVGLVALVTGGYYLIVHLVPGPRVFHFEVVGIGVGLALLWGRLTGRSRHASSRRTERPGSACCSRSSASSRSSSVIQGLFTPDG